MDGAERQTIRDWAATFDGGGVHHDPLHEHGLRAEVKDRRLPEGSEDLRAEAHRHLVDAVVQAVVRRHCRSQRRVRLSSSQQQKLCCCLLLRVCVFV